MPSKKRKYKENNSTDSDIAVDEQLGSYFEINQHALRPSFDMQTFDFSKPLVFQAIDIKAELDQSQSFNVNSLDNMTNFPDNGEGGCPVIHAYGVNEDKNSVCVHIHGYRPYIYVKMPENYNESLHKIPVINSLNKLIKEQRSGKNSKNPVINIEIVTKKNCYYFTENNKGSYLKITLAIQEVVTCTRNLFQDNRVSEAISKYENLSLTFEQLTFESNIDFEVRFMVDNNIYGCSWIECGNYKMRSRQQKVTTCQIECDVSVNNIKGFEPEGEWSKNAKTKILSFDIECISGDGKFPDANKLSDQVIQISVVVKETGGAPDASPLLKVVLCLLETDKMPDCDILWFRTEEELLIAFRDIIIAVDPDFLTGYNIQNFDFPYLVDRAKTLSKNLPKQPLSKSAKFENRDIYNASDLQNEVTLFGKITRWKQRIVKYEVKRFQSKQMGNKENKEMIIDGRIVIDILPYVQREHKLRSYRLNAVAVHFLKETKDDVKHSEIKGLFLDNPKTRSKLAHYCYKDSVLPLRLNDKLMVLTNMIEMARVTGVPMNYLILLDLGGVLRF